jgi:hypothetical protein
VLRMLTAIGSTDHVRDLVIAQVAEARQRA